MSVLAEPRFAVIIPARYESSRYPGKPLAGLRGATGTVKPLVQRSWEAAVAASAVEQVWVATDDRRIAEAVTGFGGQVVMTSSQCRNGTERCAEAIAQIPNCPDYVVNLQGDAPLTPSSLVMQLVGLLGDHPAAAMATPALRCSPSTYQHLLEDSGQGRVGGTTAIFNQLGRALYFSKRVLPHIPPGTPAPHTRVHLHLGLYAYRKADLANYAAAPVSGLELVEGLEQLRFLDQGATIQVLPIDHVGWDCIELNNPSDVPAIEAVLRERGIE
jgi:3-deoxy-manno-octulosonate cytidylyltransferase (CMP-KDO synthetase)